MAPLSFKLGNPTKAKEANTAELPAWFEDHLSRVNSENNEGVLGHVDVSLIKGEPFNHEDYSNCYSSAAASSSFPMSQQATRGFQPNKQFWENSEDGFNIFAKNGSHTNGSSNRKALDPKAFCDSIYMRLMNVLFVIADEKQAAATQQQFERLVQKLENETMDKK